MPSYKIVADSSCDLTSFAGVDFAAAPLRIITAEKEYTDDQNLDTFAMVNHLLHYKGKSSTACPGPGDWLEAFGEAERIFCITITATLSGSYNAACTAKEIYEERHPDRKVFVFNSLTTGPEMKLVMELVRDRMAEGDDFDAICQEALAYSQRTGLLFMLESIRSDLAIRFQEAHARGDVFLMAAGSADEATTAKWLKQIEAAFPGMPILYDDLSMGVSCHTGEGALGIGLSVRPRVE